MLYANNIKNFILTLITRRVGDCDSPKVVVELKVGSGAGSLVHGSNYIRAVIKTGTI